MLYIADGLRNHVKQLLAEYPDADELLVDVIADGWLGVHQAEAACEFFGLDYDENDEWIWEKIDEAAEKEAEELNAELSDLPGYFCFGHWDGGGEYGLIFVREAAE